MSRIVIACLLLVFGIQITEGQILRKIRNQTIRKVEERMEQKAVEVISEELARRAYQPVEKAMDSLLRASFRDSLDNGEEVDWEKAGEAYANFLKGMNEAADLPETFSFDISMDIEMVDYDGKKSEMVMHYSKDKAIFGIENFEKDTDHQLVVIDMDKDLIVLYSTDKKGRKSAQAIPSMMGMMSGLAAEQVEDETYTIDRTNKTKTILGYSARLFNSSTEEEYIESYVAEDFPISWQDNFGSYLEKFAPSAFAEASDAYQGMVLESTSTSKKNSDKKSTWKTTAINHDQLVIVNADYELKPLVPEGE